LIKITKEVTTTTTHEGKEAGLCNKKAEVKKAGKQQYQWGRESLLISRLELPEAKTSRAN